MIGFLDKCSLHCVTFSYPVGLKVRSRCPSIGGSLLYKCRVGSAPPHTCIVCVCGEGVCPSLSLVLCVCIRLGVPEPTRLHLLGTKRGMSCQLAVRFSYVIWLHLLPLLQFILEVTLSPSGKIEPAAH